MELSEPSAGKLVEPDGRPAATVFVKVREISAIDHPIYPRLGSTDYVDLKWSEVPLAALIDDVTRKG